MIQAPHIESRSVHGGDLSRIVAWLLDCLDRNPPPPGGDLTLYLCYHTNDLSYFASTRRGVELATELLNRYQQEAEWDELGFGSLRFDLAAAKDPAHISLTMREGFVIADSAKIHDAAQPTTIEFCWKEANELVAPGALGLVRQWRVPLKRDETIAAALTIESGADIARHTDRWQGDVRWQQPTIYLPTGRAELSVGQTVGCDLEASDLPFPLIVSYDSENEEWAWSMPARPGSFQGRQRGKLVLDYAGENGGPTLSLRGASLSPALSLFKVEADNYLPQFSFEIVGCVLPMPVPEGYGVIPEGLPYALARRVSSGVRLPGGGLLYLDRDTKAPHLILSMTNPPGQRLSNNARYRLKATGGLGEPMTGYWNEPDGVLPGRFCGELRFDLPLVSLLSRGAMAGNVPDDFFTEHADSTLGRAPVRLESPDGRHYSLVFNQTARHSVYLFNPHYALTKEFDPDPSLSIALSPGAEFILGSIRYRLRQVPDTAGNASFIEPAVAPMGGIS